MHIEVTSEENLIHIEMTSKVIEIVIRNDGKVVWINTDDGCRCRISKIEGEVHVDDRRDKQEGKGLEE